jgi:hypothetical protein
VFECGDSETWSYGGATFTNYGDGCDDCASGLFYPNGDGNDNDLDGLCDIGDPCVENIENDADGDTFCESDEVYGCDLDAAANFDDSATENNGTCIYTTDHVVYYNVGDGGAKQVGFFEMPILGSTYPLQDDSGGLVSLFSTGNLYSVLGSINASISYGDLWYGSLTEVDNQSGYYLKLSGDDNLSYAGYPNVEFNETGNDGYGTLYDVVDINPTYTLEYGSNLFTYSNVYVGLISTTSYNVP